MRDIRLSICIPTYNFGKFIGASLDSILPQLPDEVEVVILDGGSQDDTAAVVASRQARSSAIKYHRQDFRGGIDRDIEKAVAAARGKYCWLFSADDVMNTDAVSTILGLIESDSDVYLCRHDMCDLELRSLGAHPTPLQDRVSPRLFEMKDLRQRAEYFRSAQTSEAFFSFLSGPIFKKSAWDGSDVPDSFRDTHWIVAGHLLSAVARGITIDYTGKTLLRKREGNDSFSGGSLVRLCRIYIEGFQHVGNTLFGADSEEAFHIRRVLQSDIRLRTLLNAKLLAAENQEKEDLTTLDRLVRMHYADPTVNNRLRRAAYGLAYPTALKALRRLKRSFRA